MVTHFKNSFLALTNRAFPMNNPILKEIACQLVISNTINSRSFQDIQTLVEKQKSGNCACSKTIQYSQKFCGKSQN